MPHYLHFLFVVLSICTNHHSFAFYEESENDLRYDELTTFTNRWTVKVGGGKRHVIEKIAKIEGFEVAKHQIKHLNDIFFLSHPKHPEIMNFTDYALTQRLNSYEEIIHVSQQNLALHTLSGYPFMGRIMSSPSLTSSYGGNSELGKDAYSPSASRGYPSSPSLSSSPSISRTSIGRFSPALPTMSRVSLFDKAPSSILNIIPSSFGTSSASGDDNSPSPPSVRSGRMSIPIRTSNSFITKNGDYNNAPILNDPPALTRRFPSFDKTSIPIIDSASPASSNNGREPIRWTSSLDGSSVPTNNIPSNTSQIPSTPMRRFPLFNRTSAPITSSDQPIISQSPSDNGRGPIRRNLSLDRSSISSTNDSPSQDPFSTAPVKRLPLPDSPQMPSNNGREPIRRMPSRDRTSIPTSSPNSGGLTTPPRGQSHQLPTLSGDQEQTIPIGNSNRPVRIMGKPILIRTDSSGRKTIQHLEDNAIPLEFGNGNGMIPINISRPHIPSANDPIPDRVIQEHPFLGDLGGGHGHLIQILSGNDFEIPAEALSCARSGVGKGVSQFKSVVNDPKYPSEWYLHQCHQVDDKTPQYDMGVVPVWSSGNHGQGIVISVVDSGVETTHDDLKESYWADISYDLVDEDKTPDPNKSIAGNSHGTNAAGVALMKANNKICGAGMAPMATLGAVRYMDNVPTRNSSEKTSRALLNENESVDIVSCSWGVADDGQTLQDSDETLDAALKTLGQKGRDGKGTITLFAAGNGRKEGDYCGADVYVNSIYTITVASSEYDGRENAYSERCAAVMVTAYSGDGSSSYNVVATDLNNGCTLRFTGTSAATPMISGIMALVLKENKNLRLRDVQHLIAWTSQVAPLQTDGHLWMVNAAGFRISHSFGFGLANAKYLVEMAKGFAPVPPMVTCSVDIDPPKDRSFAKDRPITIPFKTDGCRGKPTEVNYLEYVQIQIYLRYPKRGAVEIKLISPSKTEAVLMAERPNDFFPLGFRGWIFSSLMTWGEKPQGQWKLIISANKSPTEAEGYIFGLAAALNGTKEKPKHYANGPRPYDPINFGHSINIE